MSIRNRASLSPTARLLGATRFRAFAGFVRWAWVVLVVSGCAGAIDVNVPAGRVEAAPIQVRETLPLRAVVVISEAELNAVHEVPIVVGLSSRTMEIRGLGQTLEHTLRASFGPLFRELSILRDRPSPGAYDLVLIPRALTKRAHLMPGGFQGGRIALALSGELQVSDRSGRLLLVVQGAGENTTVPFHALTVSGLGGNEMVALVPAVVAQVVRRWGEQLTLSRELSAYAKAGPSDQMVAAQPPAPPGPSVVLSYPADGTRVPEESLTIVGVASAPRGISRLELSVNGRPVPITRDMRVQATDVKSHTFSATVQLGSGHNLITVTAVDGDGQAAQAVRTVYREAAGTAIAAPARTGERWAVVIGIDRYKDPSIAPLRYAGADAEAVHRFLTTKAGVKPANARLLLNQDATQRNIRDVLGGFLRQKALKDDDVIIYYAGHGTTEPDASADGGVAKYLVPWDTDPTNLFASAIPMEEIDRVFGRLAARKILMIQDTCFSGGAGGRTFLAKGITVRSTALTDKFLQDLSQKEGRMILTASDVNQVSQEDPAIGHGIFTHFLLESLNGAADLDGDGAITVREVHLYLQRRVHERSNGAQTPQLYNIGDMVLVQQQRGAR